MINYKFIENSVLVSRVARLSRGPQHLVRLVLLVARLASVPQSGGGWIKWAGTSRSPSLTEAKVRAAALPLLSLLRSAPTPDHHRPESGRRMSSSDDEFEVRN